MPEPKTGPTLRLERSHNFGNGDVVGVLRWADHIIVWLDRVPPDAWAALEAALTETAGLREALEASEAECAKAIEERDAIRTYDDAIRELLSMPTHETHVAADWLEARRDGRLEAVARIDWSNLHGPLGYRSSACVHAVEPGREHLHLECQTNASRYDGTAKVAAQCKYGEEPCTCACHQEATHA